MTLSPPPFTLSDFDFELPDELIAQHPAAERSASRLLDATATPPIDRTFRELPSLLRPGDLLVVNDTRVIRARLFGTKASGGAVQALVERVLPGNEVLAHLRASKSPRPGTWVRFADAFDAEVLGRGGDRVEAQPLASPASSSPRASPTSTGAAAPTRSVAGPGDIGCRGEQAVAGTAAAASLFRLRFPADPFALLERHGHVPLPPYIRHADDAQDVERYQTVFAARPGAVAAPTAALHFDDALIKTLLAGGVRLASITLHVGGGTFQPVRTESLAEHTMHREWFEVSLDTVQAITATRAAGGRVVAVGTTSLRALESAASAPTEGRSDGLQPFSGETDIFITPGFEFRVADLLVTNFHLPKSTLMMLVSAFAGHGRVMALYRHAVAARYRFFSYGDAMLLAREPAARRAG